MKNDVKTVVNSRKEYKLEHPKGLRLVIKKGVFPRDSKVEIIADTKERLIFADNAFQVRSTEAPVKPIDISVKLAHKPSAQNKQKEDVVSFLEIRDGSKSNMIAGKLQERIIGEQKEYYVTAKWVPLKIEHDISVGAGMSIGTAIHVGAGIFENVDVKPAFHLVQHQFRMDPGLMQQDKHGNIRRSGRKKGFPCYIDDDKRNDWEIYPQDIYPACYPASWASLYSSYRVTPLHPRRSWAMGTPNELNPPPNEFGDFFSTWVMGEEKSSIRPSVSWVDDWQDHDDNPTPIKVETVDLEFWLPNQDNITQQDLYDRAALIKETLIRVVGGEKQQRPGHPPQVWFIPGKPVRMSHRNHGWVVIGVDEKGFWNHAWGPNAWAFSNYCRWDKAQWLRDKRSWYSINYISRTDRLKPEKRRLGCINLEGSSDAYKRVRFHDVFDGLNVIVINWTPNTRTTPGYLWIPGTVPLNCEGFPKRRTDPEFDKDLFGQRIPRPSFDFGECPHCNDSVMGCPHCRSRLLLPFWVHNTTLDEVITYKVDLDFWDKDQGWVDLDAKLISDLTQNADDAKDENHDLHCGFSGERWNYYGLPGPLPGEYFEIEAIIDSNTDMLRSPPWNSRGFAWYIDFHRDQLTANEIQGIRLVLTCGQRSSEQLNLVQDVKQIWFKAGELYH